MNDLSLGRLAYMWPCIHVALYTCGLVYMRHPLYVPPCTCPPMHNTYPRVHAPLACPLPAHHCPSSASWAPARASPRELGVGA